MAAAGEDAAPPAAVGATALLIAAARARESRKPASERLFADPYAESLATALGHRFLDALGAVYDDVEEQVSKFAVRTRCQIRSPQSLGGIPGPWPARYLDDLVLRRVGAAPQLVVLGVGCDCRAYRLPLGATAVFEVDLPDVLRWRRRQLQTALPTCASLVSIAGDLRDADWPAALCDAGFRPDRPAVWLLEGLLMYFTAAEARRLVAAVRRLMAPGSALVGNCLVGPCVAAWGDYYAVWARFAPPPSLALADPARWFADLGLTAVLVPLGHPACNYGRLPVACAPQPLPFTSPASHESDALTTYSGVVFFEATPDVPVSAVADPGRSWLCRIA